MQARDHRDRADNNSEYIAKDDQPASKNKVYIPFSKPDAQYGDWRNQSDGDRNPGYCFVHLW